MSNETTAKSRRSKGDGTIFKNSKGKWIARYTKKGVTTKEFSGKTKAEAKAKLDEYKISGSVRGGCEYTSDSWGIFKKIPFL